MVRAGGHSGKENVSLTCKEASRLMSAGLDKELSPAERASLRMHVAICGACQKLEKQFGFLRRALRAYSERDLDADSKQ